MPSLKDQILEDVDILADAWRRNEKWRYDLVLERIVANLGETGRTLRTVLADDPITLVKSFRAVLLISNNDTWSTDIPETKPHDGSHW